MTELKANFQGKLVDICQWVDEGLSKAEISRRLNLSVSTFCKYADDFGIEFPNNEKFLCRYISFEDYIKQDYVDTTKLKDKLVKEGLKECKCEYCGRKRWSNGFFKSVPIPLQVHHIDGDRTNNELENLALICPNCHCLTDTYAVRRDYRKTKTA